MLKEKLNELIKESMLNHDNVRLNVMRSIKAVFTKFEKDNQGITDADEENLLSKLVAEHEDSIEKYTKGGRKDLADIEEKELKILIEYAPKQPTEEEIIDLTRKIIIEFETTNGRKVTMRDMKAIFAEVQKTYPKANGKVVSGVVKSSIA